MKCYRVMIKIEECDDESEVSRWNPVAEFSGRGESVGFADRLQEIGKHLAKEYYEGDEPQFNARKEGGEEN